MKMNSKSRASERCLLSPFAVSVLLVSCNVYDPGLVEWVSPYSPDAGMDGAVSGVDGPEEDAGKDDGEQGGDEDAGGAPVGECVPNRDDDGTCSETCPEVCDGKDNDCDGSTDEGEAADSCDLPHAVSECADGECAIAECRDLFGDCDDDESNGCETSFSEETDCGGCGNLDEEYDCTVLPNVDDVSCVAHACVIDSCRFGFSDCDGDASNGCEIGGPSCDALFDFPPSNFDPDEPAVFAGAGNQLTLDCGISVFNSETLTFSNWCGEYEPTPVVREQTGGPEAVIVPFGGLNVVSGSTLKLDGDRPVIIAVYGDATIDGVVDAGAGGSAAGPGADQSDCAVPDGNDDTDDDNGGGGGGGGGFGAAGGGGGSGHDGGASVAGGSAAGNAELVPLRGGCSGGRGGRGKSSSAAGRGGGGGGAVQISVSGSLSVNGTISAAGGGGRIGDQQEDGGGGGGSGGAILLEGDTVTVATGAVVAANGGGGASGNQTNSTDGADGEDGGNDATAAAGGTAGNGAGNGGDGGASGSEATGGQDGQRYSRVLSSYNGAGGGGGGGSAGRIRISGNSSCSLQGSTSAAADTTACP